MNWLFLFLLPLVAHAYPEFARHGYTNCITCHASPTGGGILTEYGRAIAKELLSHGSFFFEKKMDLKIENSDEQFLNGSTHLPRGLSLGGDVRALQLFIDNPQKTSGDFIFMQADLEAALSDGKRIVVDGTIGRAEPDGQAKYINDYLVSRRHWVSVKMGPAEAMDRYQMRFGRFFPAYGLNIAEHTSVTRQQLGFDQQQETYNAELSYISEEWSVFATYLLGRPDNPSRNRETGAAVQVSKAFGPNYRVGANIFYGRDSTRMDRTVRRMGGAFALFGFTPKFYALTDLSFTHDAQAKAGIAEWYKLGWEFSQGVHLLGIQQYGKPSFAKSEAFKESYALGLQYFPRVHWDFLVTAGKSRSTSLSRDFNSFLWILLHYYL